MICCKVHFCFTLTIVFLIYNHIRVQQQPHYSVIVAVGHMSTCKKRAAFLHEIDLRSLDNVGRKLLVSGWCHQNTRLRLPTAVNDFASRWLLSAHRWAKAYSPIPSSLKSFQFQICDNREMVIVRPRHRHHVIFLTTRFPLRRQYFHQMGCRRMEWLLSLDFPLKSKHNRNCSLQFALPKRSQTAYPDHYFAQNVFGQITWNPKAIGVYRDGYIQARATVHYPETIFNDLTSSRTMWIQSSRRNLKISLVCKPRKWFLYFQWDGDYEYKLFDFEDDDIVGLRNPQIAVQGLTHIEVTRFNLVVLHGQGGKRKRDQATSKLGSSSKRSKRG